jgi:hypothetical protein
MEDDEGGDNLTQEQLEEAGTLIQFFDRSIIVRLQSPEWHVREQALQEIYQNLHQYQHKEGFTNAIK